MQYLFISKQQSTQTGWYTIAACFPFEPMKKCVIFKNIFPGLSRSWNFQEKESRTFQEAWEPRKLDTLHSHSTCTITNNTPVHQWWLGTCDLANQHQSEMSLAQSASGDRAWLSELLQYSAAFQRHWQCLHHYTVLGCQWVLCLPPTHITYVMYDTNKLTGVKYLT